MKLDDKDYSQQPENFQFTLTNKIFIETDLSHASSLKVLNDCNFNYSVCSLSYNLAPF
jgi:hypothetical protein